MSKIYHTTENISLESGGVRTVLVNLDKNINERNINSSIILTNKKEVNDAYLEFPSKKFKSWCYSNELKNIYKLTSKKLIFCIYTACLCIPSTYRANLPSNTKSLM